MAPNLFVLAQTAIKPHRWFKSSDQPVSLTRTEVWSEPIPGVYKHTPGHGWALVAVHEGAEVSELDTPRKVAYCKCLHRYLFDDEFQSRKMQGYYLNRPAQKEPVTFFRMDDDVTWVQSFDSDGKFIPGPYERFVLDTGTGKFRPMLKADDPEWQARRISGSTASSSVNSAVSSLHCSSGLNSTAVSRQNSFDRHSKSQTRPLSSSSLKVPNAEQSRSSSSRASSRARPICEEDLPRL